MMSRRPRRPSTCLSLGLALSVLLVSGCAPPDDIEVGLNEVHTDVVFGATSSQEDLPVEAPTTQSPIVLSPRPPAPSFIAPPPVVDELPAPPPRPAPPVVLCPSAGLYEVPEPAGAEIKGKPAEGVYPFDQRGSFQIGEQGPFELPAQTERTVRDVVATGDGGYRYQQVAHQFGATTTTRYDFVRAAAPPTDLLTAGNANTEGIYIASVRTARSGGKVEVFEPASPGLRIFPTPASIGVVWDSVAVDPVRGAAMKLTGAIRERFRVDACGQLIEGWRSEVTIDVTSADSDYVVKADYIVIPQLGGLIAADKVDVTGRYQGADVKQTGASSIKSLTPVRPAPVAPA
jgi:hypothetical protein